MSTIIIKENEYEEMDENEILELQAKLHGESYLIVNYGEPCIYVNAGTKEELIAAISEYGTLAAFGHGYECEPNVCDYGTRVYFVDSIEDAFEDEEKGYEYMTPDYESFYDTAFFADDERKNFYAFHQYNINVRDVLDIEALRIDEDPSPYSLFDMAAMSLFEELEYLNKGKTPAKEVAESFAKDCHIAKESIPAIAAALEYIAKNCEKYEEFTYANIPDELLYAPVESSVQEVIS